MTLPFIELLISQTYSWLLIVVVMVYDAGAFDITINNAEYKIIRDGLKNTFSENHKPVTMRLTEHVIS